MKNFMLMKLTMVCTSCLLVMSCATQSSINAVGTENYSLVGSWLCSQSSVDQDGSATLEKLEVNYLADNTYTMKGATTFSDPAEPELDTTINFTDQGTWEIENNQLIEVSSGDIAMTTKETHGFAQFMLQIMNEMLPSLMEAIDYTSVSELTWQASQRVLIKDITEYPEIFGESVTDNDVYQCERL